MQRNQQRPFPSFRKPCKTKQLQRSPTNMPERKGPTAAALEAVAKMDVPDRAPWPCKICKSVEIALFGKTCCCVPVCTKCVCAHAHARMQMGAREVVCPGGCGCVVPESDLRNVVGASSSKDMDRNSPPSTPAAKGASNVRADVSGKKRSEDASGKSI